MPIRRLILNMLLAGLTVACGKTTIALNHTLVPESPGHGKATQNCGTANMAVYAALDGKGNFSDSHVIPLANSSCAIQVLVKPPAGTVTLLKEIQKTSKSYTYFLSGAILVNVWVDDIPDTFNGPDGKPLDTSPAYTDCNAAKDGLAKLFDRVAFSTVIDNGTPTGPRRCYVDAVFADDSGFEGYMAWVNPKGHGEPFHYYVTTNGVTKVVYVHTVVPLPKE
jgi:hypothetical protein